MLKQDYSAECKLCTRPFTVFTWKTDRTSRSKSTGICLTCARLKNCCQCCMLDLSFGLPITVRDAALKMIAPGPQSAVNREYYAQNHERDIEEGKDEILAEYDKTDGKARELLRRLANSEPYFKKQRRIAGAEETAAGGDMGEAPGPGAMVSQGRQGPGPIRTTRGAAALRGARGGRGGARAGRGFPSAAMLPPTQADIAPPADKTITSLFITGIEDDLPEHKIRDFFTTYGKLRSLVCSHMSHCAFVNYASRESAEAAAGACQGKAVIAGCPLRVQWGRPKPIGTMDRDERASTGREGRSAFATAGQEVMEQTRQKQIESKQQDELANLTAVAPPPGQDEPQYASLAGN